jgi:hypothetical protein
MMEFPDLPDAEEFLEVVKQYEKKYANLEMTYLRAV